MSAPTKIKPNPVISSSLMLSFALLGDTLLYPVLPLHAAQLGVPVVWIGFLLSINRFVRLVANPLVAFLFSKIGFRKLSMMAALFSVLTTLLYGVAPTLSIWIMSRLVWGMCFSILRISTVCYCSTGENLGTSLGLSRSLQEIGPLFALLLGPLILGWTSSGITFILLGILTLPAPYFARKLPELPLPMLSYSFRKISFPSTFNLLVFISSLLLEGILIVVISKLLVNEYISFEELTLLASFYLLYRRICIMLLSPLSGWLADRWGFHQLFTTSLLISCLGLFLIAFGYQQVGIMLCFTFGPVISALSPAGAIKDANNRLKDIATHTTWRDIGAALGALLGGLLLDTDCINEWFIIAALLMSILLISHTIAAKHTLKQVLKWK
jgi:DHA1 family multidrug resistance protein-like MFS transporter